MLNANLLTFNVSQESLRLKVFLQKDWFASFTDIRWCLQLCIFTKNSQKSLFYKIMFYKVGGDGHCTVGSKLTRHDIIMFTRRARREAAKLMALFILQQLTHFRSIQSVKQLFRTFWACKEMTTYKTYKYHPSPWTWPLRHCCFLFFR